MAGKIRRMSEQDYMAAIGQRLGRLRQIKGWSQEDAAREVGVSVTTWRAWERGRREPYAANWNRISEVFNVPVSVLREISDPARLEERIADLERRIAELEKRLQ